MFDEGCCPWCGEKLYDPFTGKDVTFENLDTALEAHAEECETFLAEQG
jgi:hypothetical protein